MASALKRSIAFLLVLVLAIGMIPTAFAAESEPVDSTIPAPHATDPPDETIPEETLPVSQTEPETISLPENELDFRTPCAGNMVFPSLRIPSPEKESITANGGRNKSSAPHGGASSVQMWMKLSASP